ncbi:MAG: hypothetical protein ACLFPP_07635 [Spirochaetaceae bacterium]
METNALFAVTIERVNDGLLAYQGTAPIGGLPEEVDYELYLNR